MSRYATKVGLLAWLLSLLLGGCGYHLVGHDDGSGAIPADVQTVSIAVSGDDTKVANLLRHRLESPRYTIIDAKDAMDLERHAMVRVNLTPVSFAPSAYDASGVASQYGMVFGGSIAVDRNGKTIWQSGTIQQQGNVYVSGGPTSIEASRERLLKDLRQAWVKDAVGRLRSGF